MLLLNAILSGYQNNPWLQSICAPFFFYAPTEKAGRMFIKIMMVVDLIVAFQASFLLTTCDTYIFYRHM